MKSINNKYSRLLLALTLVMAWAMSSCRSSRVATETPATESLEWHDVYMPVKLNLKSPSSMSMSGRATMVRDSVINLSMRVLGFEVAVANITNDSVWLVDKYHKYMFAEPLSAITGTYRMSVGDIQDMLLRRAALDDEIIFDNARSDSPVSVKFSDPVTSGDNQYYSDINLSAKLSNIDVAATLEWSLSSAKWNENRQVNFAAPTSGYTVISAASVAKMLKSLSQ